MGLQRLLGTLNVRLKSYNQTLATFSYSNFYGKCLMVMTLCEFGLVVYIAKVYIFYFVRLYLGFKIHEVVLIWEDYHHDNQNLCWS